MNDVSEKMKLEQEDLANKVLLEVGSGRGDTTRKLVDLLAGKHDTQLIVTDISDTFFSQLREEFRSRHVPIQFCCTGARNSRGSPMAQSMF